MLGRILWQSSPNWSGNLGSEVCGLFKSSAPPGGPVEEGANKADAVPLSDADFVTKATLEVHVGSAEVGQGTPFSAVCSNVPACPTSPSLSGIMDVPQPVAPEVSGPVAKKKSSIKKYSAKSQVTLGSKHLVAGLCRRLDADLGDTVVGASAGVASSPSMSLFPVWSPVSTARKSRRARDGGETIAVKAAHRATAKDAIPTGTPGRSSHVRLVLSSLPDSHLVHVLSNSGIAFDLNVGSPSSLLSVIRANEVAQPPLLRPSSAQLLLRPQGPSRPLPLMLWLGLRRLVVTNLP